MPNTPDNKKIISLATLSTFKNLLIQDFNGRYVPYSGADASVNLGANNFITSSYFEARSVSNDVINAYTRYRAGSVVVEDSSAQNTKIINFPTASNLENSNTFATQEWANSNLVKINDNINIVHTGSTAHGSVTVNSPTGIQSEAYVRIRTYAESQYAYGELIVSGYSGTTRYRRDYIQVGSYNLNFPSISENKTLATTDQLLSLVSSGGNNGSASTAARSDHTHALATAITYDDNNNEVLGQSGFMNTYEKTWLTAALENNILGAGTTFYRMGSISYLKLPGPGQGTNPQQRSLSFPNSSGTIATQEWVGDQGYTTNQGTVIGSGLTADTIVLGNGTVNIKTSSYKPGPSSVTWNDSSDIYLPTMKSVKAYVEGKGYTTNTGTVTSVTIGVGTGLAIDNASAITTSGTRTISIASNYKLPTTSEWNAKANSADLGSAAAKNYTTSVASGSSDLVTSGAVFTAISNLPTPMQFRGTLGVGGTISALPDASASNNGYTYKVISNITYAGQSAKVGDVFVSNGTSWVLIPAGDDVEDTWREIYVNDTSFKQSGISSGKVNFKSGSNVTLRVDGDDIIISSSYTNSYHKTGSWSGLTYTATNVNTNDNLVFTIPTGTTASTVALGNHNHDSVYLKLAGGTMTGVLTLKGDQYYASNSVYGMNANNSDIVGVNSIYTQDLADTTSEGIRFYRDSTHWDSFTISGGVMYFMANDSKAGSSLSSAKIVLHSGNIGSYAVTSLAGSGSATSAARSDHTHTSFNGLTINTQTDTTPLIIQRSGSNAESVSYSVNDAQHSIVYTNDEVESSIKWTLVNTDTEGSDGSRASTHYMQFIGSDGRVALNIDGTVVSMQGHTHQYAGSSSVGGAANSANKLNTNAGSLTNPVYFANGIPVACTYSLNKTVPSDAVFTDTHNTHKIISGYKQDGTTQIISASASNGNIELGASGITAGWYKRVYVNAKGIVVNGDQTDSDANTWRPIKYGSTTLNDTSTTLEFAAGSNVQLSFASGKLTISATDTTYTNGTGLTLSNNQFSISSANVSTILNLLTTGSSTPTDADYYISQYVGGGTNTTTYHRRPMSALWEYIKGKGVVTGIKVGTGSTLSPSSGVVTLPAYPTTLPADGGDADTLSGYDANDFARTVKIGTTAYSPTDGVVSLPAYPTKASWNYDDVYLKLAGGTLTGNLVFKKNGNTIPEIRFQGSQATYTMIKFLDNTGDSYGNGISIGGGGSVVIGAGESADNIVSGAGVIGGTETLYLGSDNNVYLITNVQSGYSSAKTFTFDASGNLSVPGTISEGGQLLSNKYQAKGTYAGTSVATQSANGLMSSTDKTRLDNMYSALNGTNSSKIDTIAEVYAFLDDYAQTTDLATLLSSKVTGNTAITGATKCKITYDSKGLVTGGQDLSASDIPNLNASKITDGTFADARIASAATWNAKYSLPSGGIPSGDVAFNYAGSSSKGGNATLANAVLGSYTGNGGKQNPNYFGVNKVGFLMMNTTVNGNSQYKDWMIMDCYSGSDVGGAVAIGVNRQSLGAYIMRSAAGRTEWAEVSELLGTHNLGYTASGKNYPVQADSNKKLYVNVPWEDNNTHNTHKIISGYKQDGTTQIISASASNGNIELGASGITAGWYKRVYVNAKGIVVNGDQTDSDANTWRPIKYGSTTLNDTSTTLEFAAGSNVQLSFASGKLTISATDTTYNFSGTTFYSGNQNNAEHDANNAVKNGNYYYSSNGPATSLGASTADGALYVQSYSDSWVGQIAQDYRNGRLFVRGKNNGTWQSWKRIANYDELPTESTVSNWGFTKNQGTVTSVRVQAGTGLASSQNTAQSGTLNTTISIASGYKLPTTDEWNSKLDMSDVYGFGDYVMEAFLNGNYPSFIKLVNDGNDNPKFEFDTTNYSVVSGVNDGTNWTSLTVNGVTKNIPSGGGGGIAEISTQYIRIWDLNPGIYLLTYNGTKYIYYSGASGTSTHTVKGGAGQVILTVETYSTTTKAWYYDSINTSVGLASYTRFYGRTSSSSGSTSSTLLAPKYKHTILFTVNGYGSCKYDFINNSSSDISVLELINELIGKALGDMSETSGDAYFVFGNQNGDRLNPTINCTRYSVYNGTTINYVVSGGAGLTINSQAATQI